MELLVVVLVALVLCLMNSTETVVLEEVLERETMLNPDFYVDENAFMEVANALGFGIDSNITCGADVGMRTQPIHAVPPNTENNVCSENDWYSDSVDNSASSGTGRGRRLGGMARSNN